MRLDTQAQALTGPDPSFGPVAGIEAAIDAGSLPKERTMLDACTTQIRELNDAFRRSLAHGVACLTDGVVARSTAFVAAAVVAVRSFDDFTANNDPYGEHDFGAVFVEGVKLLWKIDYYDRTLRYGSKDPSDPAQTTRVLTIMLAEEY